MVWGAEMTQQELDALPDVGGGFGMTTEIRDGQTVSVPRWQGFSGVMGMPPQGQPMAVIGADGTRWRIGVVNGVLSKRRSMSQL